MSGWLQAEEGIINTTVTDEYGTAAEREGGRDGGRKGDGWSSAEGSNDEG